MRASTKEDRPSCSLPISGEGVASGEATGDAPRHHAVRIVAVAVTLGVAATACASSPPPTGTLAETTLNASGATFPKVFYKESILEFELRESRVTINYAGGGSGKGRTDLQERQVDFAGSDAVVKQEDVHNYQGGEFLYIPTVTTPITVSFHLEGVEGLRLAPDTIARIFQRDVTAWDDPAGSGRQPRRRAARHRHHGRPPFGRVRRHQELHQVPRLRGARDLDAGRRVHGGMAGGHPGSAGQRRGHGS